MGPMGSVRYEGTSCGPDCDSSVWKRRYEDLQAEMHRLKMENTKLREHLAETDSLLQQRVSFGVGVPVVGVSETERERERDRQQREQQAAVMHLLGASDRTVGVGVGGVGVGAGTAVATAALVQNLQPTLLLPAHAHSSERQLVKLAPVQVPVQPQRHWSPPEQSSGSATDSRCPSTQSSVATLGDEQSIYRGLQLTTALPLTTSSVQGVIGENMTTSSSSTSKGVVCDICGKVVASKSHLVVHKRTHTKERPFQCTQCDSAFTERSVLRTHLRTHTGEKPFKCEVCGKTFAQKKHLRAHARSHTGERPYQCEDCGSCFVQSGDLNRHVRVVNCWRNKKPPGAPPPPTAKF